MKRWTMAAAAMAAWIGFGGMPDVDVITLPGEHHGHLQDICWDGAKALYWAQTSVLFKTDLAGNVVRQVNVREHNAGLDIRDGRLYVAVCLLQNKTGGKTTPDCRVQINVHDAETLDLLQEIKTDINDRSGSLCLLEDGSFLVGCLRHPELAPDEVRFHHVARDGRLVKSYVQKLSHPVKLGIEVIKRLGDRYFLSIYGHEDLELDKDFRLVRTHRFRGTYGMVFDGDDLWTGVSKFISKTPRTCTSALRRHKGAMKADCGVRPEGMAGRVEMMNVAHRGLWVEAHLPQNTVEAIKAAYDAGAKVVETDFNETESGEIICLHDAKALASLSTVVKAPAKITPADRATINLGEKMGLPRPYRIPLLQDVLAVVPKDAVLQSEIKVYGPNYAARFDEAVKAAGLSESNIVVSSFSAKSLKDFHAKCPKYRTLWLGCGVGKKGYDVDAMIAAAKDGGFDVICPSGKAARQAGMKPADADRIRAAGFDFRFFGVNSLELLKYAATMRITGFTCDTFKAAYGWAEKVPGVTLLPPVRR